MKSSPLPPQWTCLEGKVGYVQRVSDKEYSSSCPKCGGDPHPSGEWPDRCRLFVDDHPTLFCRRCGLVAYPDQFGDGRYQPPSPDELERFRQEQRARAEARLRSAQRELQILRDSRLWEKYNAMLGERERQWWRKRGIPDVWQDIWQFGWSHDRQAATIPLFAPSGEFVNLKYRLMDESAGKYRYHLSGQPAPLFLCDPNMPLDGRHVIAVEGEIKAAVCYITLDDPNACIVGMPGLSPSAEVKAMLSQAERVTLVLDPGSDVRGPDGWSPMGKLVRDIGRRKCRVLIPPVKIDDGILEARLTKNELRQIFGTAVRV